MKLAPLVILPFIVFTSLMYSQNQLTVIDPFEEFITIKTKHNAGIGVSDRWKFQIFSGTIDDSKSAYVDFRKEFRQVDATIVFAQPIYKVWAGNTRTRIECEHLILETKKKKYESFLVKPKI